MDGFSDAIGLDLYQSWEDAQQGRLCPYEWMCLQAEYKDRDLTPVQKKMLDGICIAVQTIPQWSSEEAERQSYRERGGELLFCKFFDDHRSMFELARIMDGRYLAAFVLDDTLSPQKRKVAADEAKGEFLIWLEKYFPDFVLPDCLESVSSLRGSCFSTMENALRILWSALCRPEEISG